MKEINNLLLKNLIQMYLFNIWDLLEIHAKKHGKNLKISFMLLLKSDILIFNFNVLKYQDLIVKIIYYYIDSKYKNYIIKY